MADRPRFQASRAAKPRYWAACVLRLALGIGLGAGLGLAAWAAGAVPVLPEQTLSAAQTACLFEAVGGAGLESGTGAGDDRGAGERPLVAMLLSPRMVYSLREWPRLRQWAEHAGFRVIGWRDPAVSEAEWNAAWSSLPGAGRNDGPKDKPSASLGASPDAEVRPLPAPCHALAAPVNHWPSSWVAWRGAVHPWPILGVMPRPAWLQSLAFRQHALERQPAGGVASAAPVTSQGAAPLAARSPATTAMPLAAQASAQASAQATAQAPAPAADGAVAPPMPTLAASVHEPPVAPEACIPAVSYLPLTAADSAADGQGAPVLGSYERISPDGRFVLRSLSGAQLGQVSLVELPAVTGGALSVRRTPLRNEAFPVQGSWRYVVDVDGSHYRFAELLRLETEARPLFKGGMRGFYAAAAELPPPRGSHEPGLAWLRSMSWPQGGPSGQGTGPLQVQTLAVRDDGVRTQVVHDTGPQFICNGRRVTDGNVYTLPMLSVDGTEFSALPINPGQGVPSMRVYGLAPGARDAQHPCDLRWDLQATPGKAVFGFSQGAPAMLAYTDNASVYFVDRSEALRGQVFRIEDWKTQVLASAFPGLTRDGRIVFGATWKDCAASGAPCVGRAGYVVADPLQNPDYRAQRQRLGLPPLPACITQGDVLRERRRFADAQGLPR